jgi:uncharacterized protein YraI
LSDPKTTLLVLGAGCAAMIGVAAAIVSAGAFFSDLPAAGAQDSAFEVQPRKVKTVAIVDKPAEKGAAVAADRSPTSSVRVAMGNRVALHGASPRWARNPASGPGSRLQREALLAAFADEDVNPDRINPLETKSLPAPDPNDPFARIVTPDENSEPTVELAGTVPLVPAPAPRQDDALEPDTDKPAPKVAATGRALTDSTTINEAANIRAAPRSGSQVLAVVPDGARVSIAPGCEQWCEISYNGRRGFVYKDFVGAGRPEAKQSSKTQTLSADPLDKTIYGDSNFIVSGKQGSRSAGSDDEEKTASKAENPAPKKQLFVPPSR